MTIAEMHIAVKLGLDKSSSLELPAFEPEEIDFWLNKAILTFVDQRYSGINARQESFEENQRCIDDLMTLVEEVERSVAADFEFGGGIAYTYKPNGYYAEYPTNYLHRVGESVDILITATNELKRVGVTECTADSYNQAIENPYSEHILYLGTAKPLRLNRVKHNNLGALPIIELISDGTYVPKEYYLRYIKIPATVSLATNVSCDLPVHTHHRIVDLTVSMLLENIESNRIQSFEQKRLLTE
jgi:hypothetical protein